ncbi:MAG: phenylalanine--tRNA ligase subunit beta [Chloroflexi bacterium]|nr:phenylalanine--tRNA ligase subunit beta [Chloroflexota bacterium]
MKLPLSWLKEYVDITLPLPELAHRLTMAGLEVAAVERRGGDWEHIVVGQVLAVAPHPNADRLKLATIDTGAERHTVVCGAPNLAPGQRVAFAGLGARLINPQTGQAETLKAATIRGVRSAGMACSERELGLSQEHTGILVLAPDAPVGAPLEQVLGDAILDIKVTPNRPDCLSVLGLAREVAALTGQAVREPDLSYPEEGPPMAGRAAVEIEDAALCPRYCASLVEGVIVGPSPAWMQERLAACGMRPISNVVDITNYVMLEYGQPLHAFDYDTLREHRIVVRRARPGERLQTLDGQLRELTPDMLLIGHGAGPVALAGVMGGAATEVSDETANILLESANFSNTSIRRTSVGLRLRSEASLRFDKGLPRELPPIALRRATQLLLQLAGGRAARGIIDAYPGREERRPILLTGRRLAQVLGVSVPREEVERTLESLGFSVAAQGEADLSVTAPYWRTDIALPDDLVEEVARITGYDAIPTTTLAAALPAVQPQPGLELKERLRDLMAGCGLQEIVTYTLVGRALMESARDGLGVSAAVRVANPMSPEQEFLRLTLRGGLLAALAANARHQEAMRLFEVGRVYLPQAGDLPQEREMLAGALAGPRHPPFWSREGGSLDFFDAKGLLEEALCRLGVEASFQPTEEPFFLPGRAARLQSSTVSLGVVGEVAPAVAERFDIPLRPVVCFELDLAALLPLAAAPRYQPLPRFPASTRDLALVVDETVPAQRVLDLIRGFSLVGRVALFDVYRGEPVPAGKKSLAFSLAYQAPDRTLTAAEVEGVHQRLVQKLETDLGAALR